MKIIPEKRESLFLNDSWKTGLPWLLILAATVVMEVLLANNGRIWWCKWDIPIYIWSSDVWTKHNSQHFFDPYSFTHILHGFMFFWAARLIFKRGIGFTWMLFAAVLAECTWEVIENSAFIIDKYRSNTASLDYFGDSIANSIGDVVACIVGFWVAHKLQVWRSIILFLIIEAILMFTIKDSLLINIIMLIYPIEAIKVWQGA